jgi:hypothetical protein
MNVATTTEELADILSTMPWIKKVSSEELRTFISSTKYVEGHLAHMEYARIKEKLSDKEFLQLLTAVGTDQVKFEKYSGRFCTGDPAYRYCAVGNGYCDESWCHGH